jgi:dCMP deaminase
VLVKDRRIISTGYNGFPANLSDSLERYSDRDFKLATTIHAEKNAIFNAAKNGSSSEDATAYITWPPCSQCASALIQAGVEKVVCPNPKDGPDRWVSNFLLANELLYEAGVKVLYYTDSDLCQTETAPFAVQLGSQINFTGQPVNPAKTSTSPRLSVIDLLPKRLRDA